jgi:hypothetical protein
MRRKSEVPAWSPARTPREHAELLPVFGEARLRHENGLQADNARSMRLGNIIGLIFEEYSSSTAVTLPIEIYGHKQSLMLSLRRPASIRLPMDEATPTYGTLYRVGEGNLKAAPFNSDKTPAGNYRFEEHIFVSPFDSQAYITRQLMRKGRSMSRGLEATMPANGYVVELYADALENHSVAKTNIDWEQLTPEQVINHNQPSS